jgi:NADH dehydrogenase
VGAGECRALGARARRTTATGTDRHRSGSASEGDIAPATRDVLRDQHNVRVVLGEVVDINLDTRTVTSRALGRETVTPYGSPIVATGTAQSYFGHDEFKVDAPGLQTLDDALEVRGRIFGAFEMAESSRTLSRRAAWLTFAVVGAGRAGAEMAGQLAELSRQSLRANFRNIDPAHARITRRGAPDPRGLR